MRGVIDTGIDPIEQDQLNECWWYDGAVRHRQVGNVRIAECDDFAVLAMQCPDAGPAEFRAVTRRLYDELLTAVGQTEHGNIVRF